MAFCYQCGMACGADTEYHPFAACLMYLQTKDVGIVKANLKAVEKHGAAVERARNAKLEAALRVLVPLCIDALREAEGISEEELFDQLQKAELIELTLFDPEKHGEIEGVEPGFEIWVLTDLGKEFAEGMEG